MDVTEEILNLVASGKAKDVSSRTRELFGSSSSSSPSEAEDEEIIPRRQSSSAKATASSSRRSNKQKAFATMPLAEYSDGFDEDLYGDGEDRQRLMALTEIEREAILYERAQARHARTERRELERKVRELELLEQQKQQQQQQRKPSTAAECKRKTLSQLKAMREKRQKRRKRTADDGGKDSDYVVSGEEGNYEDGELVDVGREGGSEEDESTENEAYSEGSAEEEYVGRRKRSAGAPAAGRKSVLNPATSPVKTTDSITLELANQIRLSRDTIVRWIYHPEFDELARNSLLRLAIGSGPDGQQVYRLVQIKKVVPYYRAYRIGGPSGATTAINKAAVLKYGKSERTFRLDVVSNSDFTQREFERWLAVLHDEKQLLPARRHAEAKAEDWQAFRDRPVSDETVQAMVTAKRELGQGHRNLVAEKTMLLHQREEAAAAGNLEELEQIDLELTDLARELEEAQSKKSTSSKRLEALAELNKRNRQLNISLAREAERLHQGQGGQLSGTGAGLDPFSRRKCQPTSYHNFGSDNEPESAVAPPPAAAILTLLDGSLEKEQPTTKAEHPPLPDLFAAHNVDIDIDL